jgi:hypothetical protein
MPSTRVGIPGRISQQLDVREPLRQEARRVYDHTI